MQRSAGSRTHTENTEDGLGGFIVRMRMHNHYAAFMFAQIVRTFYSSLHPYSTKASVSGSNLPDQPTA